MFVKPNDTNRTVKVALNTMVRRACSLWSARSLDDLGSLGCGLRLVVGITPLHPACSLEQVLVEARNFALVRVPIIGGRLS